MGIGRLASASCSAASCAAPSSARRCCRSGIALPIFASDALSSVAYAPDEIFLTLSLARHVARTHVSWKIGIAVAFVMLVVVASYRQNVHAYPVRRRRLRGRHGQPRPDRRADRRQRAARRLRAHRRGVDLLGRAERRVGAAVARGHEAIGRRRSLVVVLMAMNLRGVRESGTAFAVPTYRSWSRIIGMARLGLHPAAAPATCPTPRARSLDARAASGATNGLDRPRPWPSCCCAPSPPAARR